MIRYVNTPNGGSLNMRESPNGATIKKIPNKTKLEVEVVDDKWAKTTYEDAEGYVMISFLAEEIEKVSQADLKSIYNDLKSLLKKLEGVLK